MRLELCALGMAIHSVVTVAEILKKNGFAFEKKIRTLTVDVNDNNPDARVPISKAKIEIILGKSEMFDELIAAETDQRREVGADADAET